MPLTGKRAVLVIAHSGYREEELDEPRRALERAGAHVRVASSSLGAAHGMSGGTCEPDLLYSAIQLDDLDALVFVGGTGASEYFPDRTAHRLAREAAQQEKVLGAICFASSTLANAGVLEGLQATGFPSREAHLRSKGVVYTGDPVTTTGRIVTGRGPEDARAFGDALVEALSGSASTS
jgi:protease I